MSPQASNAPAASLRPFLAGDTPVLAAILSAAIFDLTGDDYDNDQQEAWAAIADDEPALAARLGAALTLVAERAGAPVGFIALTDNRTIDLLYVHPDVVGEGIGTLLCDAIERLATARGAKSITVDASDTALDFFRKRGYIARQRNTVTLGTVWIGNTTVEKTLAAAPTAS